ncbi:hypothetical protein [Jeotgalibacillus campisalis]|uniref:Pilus assembly protein PilO n=1 Tax=Jeotgalibacillus campisalis TaxID=220754 RepID=A0A0C2VP30_9BACL|nr:hypothetical protein [Jeotgalibacillus campisalis]KIL46206.1 hypothetical protein KR50_28810 [Jeotgalibacillus campisalis]
MNNRFSRPFLITLLLGAAAIFIPLILYFNWLHPLNSQLEDQQGLVENEQALVSALLENQLENPGEEVLTDSASLQKQIPVKPLTEQLLLDLEKAELLSNSFIESIAITETELSAAALQPAADPQMENPLDEPEEEATAVSAESSEEMALITEGLHKVSVSLTVQSPTYFELQRFLTVVEELPRIMEVEQIGFTDTGEVISLNDSAVDLSFSITIAAYYHPGLDELIEDLPSIDSPAPANKKTPLSTFPGEQEEEDESI